MKMDRPRRSCHLPVSLGDYMIVKDESDLQSDGNELKIDCDFVDSVTSGDESEKELREKKEKICQKQPYKCEECKAQYRSKAALMRHSVQHKGESPFLCTECGKGLSSQYALSEHMNIHTNSKPHKCETCGHESRQLSVHLRHLLTHSTQLSKIYTCNICSKKFKQNEYLKKHKRKHTGEKPFTCSDCDKSFTCKSELNRHSKRHSTDRPFKCNICYQSFKMQHNLRSHMRQHSMVQELKCPNCPATFTKSKQLETHRKSHLESAQVLQVLRPNSSTLVVTSQGEDKRRLPIHYTFTLHKEGEDSASAQESFERKYLRINDNEIPLSLIIKSIGSGNSIQIKIPDEQRQHTSQDISLVSGFSQAVEIIDEGEVLHSEFNNETTPSPIDQSSNKDSAIEDAEENSIKCESLSVESLESHFMNECQTSHFMESPAPDNDDYFSWLGNLSSLAKQLQPPLKIQICKVLIDLTGKLQCFLVKPPSLKPMETFQELCKQSSDIRSESNFEEQTPRTPVNTATLDSFQNNSQYSICKDLTQYQILLQHYTILMQTLQSHFSAISNSIPHR